MQQATDRRWATIDVESDTVRFTVWRNADDGPTQVDAESVPLTSIPPAGDTRQVIVGASGEPLEERAYEWLEVEFTPEVMYVDLFHWDDERGEPGLSDTVDVDGDDLSSFDGHVVGDAPEEFAVE